MSAVLERDIMGTVGWSPNVPFGVREEYDPFNDISDDIKRWNVPSRPSPIWRLQPKSTTIIFRKPLLVNMRREGDLVFVENETLSIYASGKTSEDAMIDFALHVLHFYEYYAKLSDNQVIGRAKELKKLYSALIERHAD